jgi:hypothetical protein
MIISYFGPTIDCFFTFVTATLLSCMFCARARLDEPSTADASMRRRGTSKARMRMRLSMVALVTFVAAISTHFGPTTR